MERVRPGAVKQGVLKDIMRKIIFICAVLTLLPRLSAETLRFRSGEILCAELSKTMPYIMNREDADLTDLPENKIYAALTVSLDPGRRISIYDYSLKVSGTRYRCIALRSGDNTIDGAKYECSGGGRNARCTLFFVLNAREVGTGGSDRLRLVCNAIPDAPEIPVVFVNRGSDNFTAGRDIPDSGMLTAGK